MSSPDASAGNAPRVAVLGYPSDRGQGGGFILLSRIGPALQRRGGALAWVEDLYAEDEPRLARWRQEGVKTILLNRPTRRVRRWWDRLTALGEGSIRELSDFHPHVLIVASGTDQPSPGDDWRGKRQIAEALRQRHGTRLILMHQVSEAGNWIADEGDARDWLQWQREADWHQFVSAATWRETEENLGFRLRGEVVRNNYKVPHADPPPWPRGAVLRMAFVGRLEVRQKGLDLLVDALAAGALRGREDWHFEFHGTGRDGAALRRKVEEAGLGRQVSWCGRTEAIRGIWERNHLLVMPSRSEGLSLALTEAMLCERHAVASLVGGTGDLLVDGESGFRTHLAVDHLSIQLQQALSAFRAGRLEQMGREAGRQARQIFPPDPEATYVEQLAQFHAGRRSDEGS